MIDWLRQLREVYQERQQQRREAWPYPEDEFVQASELVDRGATDEEVRDSIQAVEDGGRR